MPIVILQLLIPTLLLFSPSPVRTILLVVFAAARIDAAFAKARIAVAFATAIVVAALAVASVAAATPIACPNATMIVNNRCETKPNVEEEEAEHTGIIVVLVAHATHSRVEHLHGEHGVAVVPEGKDPCRRS